MGGTHEPIKKRRSYLQTVSVDVDIDASVLEDNGYHHEEDCPAKATDEDSADVINVGLRALSDWHDHNHGLTLWANCPHDPCRLLSDDFRSTP